MKSQREIHAALQAGEKICKGDWDPSCYVWYNDDGNVVNEKGSSIACYFGSPKDWRIWTPQPRKVYVNFYGVLNSDEIIALESGDLHLSEHQARASNRGGAVVEALEIELPTWVKLYQKNQSSASGGTL